MKNHKLIKFLKPFAIATVATASLTSCATLSREECMVGDWYAIGMADGAKGYDGKRLSEHSKACAKAGVAPNVTAWEKGRQQGLKQYCTDANAYALGKRGRTLNAVCPASQVANLSRINADGRRFYALTNQLNEEKRQLKKYKDEYKKLREGDNLKFKSEKEARAYLVGLPDKARTTQTRINRLTRELDVLRSKYGY